MITSRANQKVKQIVQWQTSARERRSAGIYLVEGFKMYEEAPAESVREVYISEEALEKAKEQPALWERLGRVGYETVSSEVFCRMSDTRSPQGILCVMERREYDLERLLQTADPLFMVLENLQDPGNLGTIVRSGEGAGVTGVIMDRETVDIYNPKTIRATMGSVYRVPFVRVEDMRETVRLLQKRGICCYAARVDGEKYYDGFSFREGTAFLVGNEGNGLSGELAGLADEYVKIPMEGQLESLNASVAAALLMYEARRQREKGRAAAQKRRKI